jgi:hypothetical protein
MSYSQKKSVLHEIEGEEAISRGTMAYLCERVRNNFYHYVMSRFREAEAEGLTKAELARRIGKTPDRINHILGAPGNWTLDTATELLVGVCREELTPYSTSYSGRPKRNIRAPGRASRSTRNVIAQ